MKKLLCLLFALAISACQFGEKRKPASPIIEPEPITKFVDYRVEKIDHKTGPCLSDSTSKRCVVFQIEYPVINGMVSQPVMDKINRGIENDILSSAPVEEGEIKSINGMMEGLSRSYSDLISEFEDYEQAWVVEINADILYQSKHYISLASTIFNYTGGAHPNNNQLYKSYNLQTGEAISLDDLFIDGFENSLNQSAEIEFRMQKEIPPNNSLESAGYWFEDNRFKLNDNFAIINNSLIFYFNPYEIGPYSLGATELELKLTDYVDLIDPNGPISALKN